MDNGLWAALLAIQGEALQIQQDAEGQVGTRRYNYVSLKAVNQKVLPRLSHYGLAWVTQPVIQDGEPALYYELRHVATGQHVYGVMSLAVGSQPNPQDQGSGLTYARRYALMAVLNLTPTETDDDGAAASAAPKPRRLSQRRRDEIQQWLDENFEPREIPLFLGKLGVTNAVQDWTTADQAVIRAEKEKMEGDR